ncbi:MAG: hypothetical protein PVH25_05520 [Burkholderiales bacterium]|jgi:hypothetical protein
MLRKCLAATSLCLAIVGNVFAQTRTVEDDQELLNWYYAATYGTGIYSAGDRTVVVLQAPFSFSLRESSEDQWGLRITLPISLGFYDFDLGEVVDNGLPSRVSTVSVVPGLEFEKRVTPRWLLRPYASTGYGWELGGDESAWIYDVGVRSRYELWVHRETVFSLLNWLSLAGYTPSGGAHQPLGLFAIGVDMEVPTNATLFGRRVAVSIAPIYYYYFAKLDFAIVDDPDNKLNEQSEIAISVVPEQPFRVLDIDVNRVGIAFRVTQDLTGFRIFTSLPF